MPNSRTPLHFNSVAELLVFSIINSVFAGIVLSLYFENMQILAAMSLAWVVCFGLIALGDYLQNYCKSDAAPGGPAFAL